MTKSFTYVYFKMGREWGTLVAKSGRYLTLGFGWDRAVMVYGFESCVRLYADSVEPAGDSFSLSLTLHLSHLCFLFLS